MIQRARPVILILGMPGSGKTTVGSEIAEYLQIPFRSMGDLLRAGRKSGTLPSTVDPATALLLLDILRTPKVFLDGFVLDFSPVRADAYTRLKRMLHKQRFELDYVIYIRISPSDGEERCVCRGHRPGDQIEDIRQSFKRRLTKEFWPFTLPIIRSAYKLHRLLILDNSTDEVSRKNEAKRVADTLRVRGI